MSDVLAVILMGSASDLPHVDKIKKALDRFEIPHEARISSAHKTPARLLEIIKEYEADPRPKVYISVAGRSNALSGLLDAQVAAPVISCPPGSTAFGGADLFSSLRMPSGVAPMLVLEPANAALAVAKILALADPDLKNKIAAAQSDFSENVNAADRELTAK